MGASEDWKDFAAEYMDLGKDLLAYMNPPALVPTGIVSLDQLLGGGLAPGMNLLMAEPGAGKSAFALCVSVCYALTGGNVFFVSAEMTREQCLARCCSMLSVSMEKPFAWSEWEQMGARLRSRCTTEGGLRRPSERELAEDPYASALMDFYERCPGLVIADEGKALAVDGLCEEVRKGRKAGLGLLVVDYLQRLRPAPENKTADRFVQISEASKAITALTKELELPALVVSSMSREGISSGKPKMTAARGSGELEYDAVTVMTLMDGEGRDGRGRQPKELYITKNRRGCTTSEDEPIELEFDGPHSEFSGA